MDLPAPPPNRSGWPWTITHDSAPAAAANGSAWPRVTVVTPSFNQADFIEETIRSVLLQGYPNLEYIIIDGGSTDGSVDIVKKYEEFLTYWVSEPDGGQTDAINKGLRRGTGDILAYLNSDDIYLPGAIISSIAFLQRHPETSLMYAYAERTDGNGRIFERVKSPPFDLRLLATTCFIRQPTVFFRRCLLDEAGYFDVSLNYCMDYEYWFRASQATTPTRLERFTATDRFHPAARAGSQHHLMARYSLLVVDRAFASGILPSRDTELVRSATLPRLLLLAGQDSGSSAEDRAAALDRLRALEPAPTRDELVKIIAAEDGYFQSPYIPTTAEFLERDQADVYAILPALVAGAVISHQDAAEVRRRLEAYARVRQIIRIRAESGGPHAAARLVREVFQTPSLVTTRPWWVEIGRSTAFGRAVVPLYYQTRDVGYRLRAWQRDRSVPGGDRTRRP
jgi:Glycosyl transferase family 2